MKVALCYRGHYYRERTCHKGSENRNQGSSFFYNYENHKSHLISCYDDIDIFFHTYSVNEELDNKLISALNAKKYQIERSVNYEMRHSILKVNAMFDYTDYDLVINTRFDLHYKKKIIDFNINPEKINFLWKEDVPMWKRRRDILAEERTSDLMWIFDAKYTKIFSVAYSDIYDEVMGDVNPRRDGHTLYYTLAKKMKLEGITNIISEERFLSGMQKPNPYLHLNRRFR